MSNEYNLGYGGAKACGNSGNSDPYIYAGISTNTISAGAGSHMVIGTDLAYQDYPMVTVEEERVWVTAEECYRRGIALPPYESGRWEMRVKNVYPHPEPKSDGIPLFSKPHKRNGKYEEILQKIRERRADRRLGSTLERLTDEAMKDMMDMTMRHMLRPGTRVREWADGVIRDNRVA